MTSPTTPDPSPASPAAPEPAERWVALGPERGFAGEGPHGRRAATTEVVLVRGPAGLAAFEGRCPHQGALLGEGEMEGGRLVCRNHRWAFDPATGERVGGPGCLKRLRLRSDDGGIAVAVPEPRGTLHERARLAAAATGGGRVRTLDELPGPRGLPLVGSLFELDPETLHLTIETWARTFQSPFLVRAGTRRIVVVTEPADMAPILRDRPDRFRRVSGIEHVFRELGIDGVFSAEGAAWRPQRRLAMEALSQKNLRGFYPTLEATTRRLLRRWDRAAAEGRAFDPTDEFRRFTVDVTTQLVFGHDANTLEHGDEDPIRKSLELVFPALTRRLNALWPYWRFVRLPADRALDRAMAELHAWVAGVVAVTRRALAEHPERAEAPTNFMEAMLAARDDEGRPFGEETIFGNALTMLAAGEDTTANTLAWALHELAEAPAAWAALRAEADVVLGASDVAPDLERVGRLAYANAVAQETMRMRLVAPLAFVEPNEDVVLGGVAVPRGATVFIAFRPETRDPAHFADPNRFWPERWLGAADDRAHEPGASIPFGSGPRICPGRGLALLEIRVALSAIARRYDFVRTRPREDVRERFAFTMTPIGLGFRPVRRA